MQRHEHYAAQSSLLRVVLAAKSSTTNAHRQLDVIVVAAAAVARVTPSQLCCCLWVARAAMNVIVERGREKQSAREPESAFICGVEKAGKMNATLCVLFMF